MSVLTDTLIVMLVFATLAQAWSWLGSYGGIVSFGHAVFFGIGGYAVAISNLRGGSAWYGALGGALFAVAIAAICGVLLLHGRGYVFGLVTLAAGALAEPFAANQHWVGVGNSFAFPRRLGFLNLQFEQAWPYLLLALAVFAVSQALTFGLRATRTGYYMRALRSNPVAARSLGIAARPSQLLALVASAFVTSVAGSFFAEYRMAIDPHAAFGFAISLDIALAGIVAGPASPWGAPAAGIAFVALTRLLPVHSAGLVGDLVLVFEGLAVVLIALLRPHGLFAGFVRRPSPAVLPGSA